MDRAPCTDKFTPHVLVSTGMGILFVSPRLRLGSLLASIVVTTRGQEENLIEDYDDERAHNPQTIPRNGPVMHPLAFGTEPNWPLADTICCNNHAWAERPGYQDEVNGGRWMDSAIASSAPCMGLLFDTCTI